MASKLNYSQACEQAQLNATTAQVGNAGLLYLYSGVQPSGPAGADGTLVAGPFTLGSPFAPAASAALPSRQAGISMHPTLGTAASRNSRPRACSSGPGASRTWARLI